MSDVISITEKTFDLSIDTNESESEEEREDKQYKNKHIHRFKKVISEKDLNGVYGEAGEADEADANEDNEDDLNEHSYKDLLQSLLILQKMSGTDVLIPPEHDIELISKKIHTLCLNSELKLSFLEQNYEFIEHLYEDLLKEHKQTSQQLKQLQTIQQNIDTTVQGKDKLIEKQRLEIIKYKNFIKEMMK